MKVVFVAGKLAAASGWEVRRNIQAAKEMGIRVAQLGAMPIIPHANTGDFFGTGDEKFWRAGYREILKRCDAVVLVPGWQSSDGTRAELDEASKRSIPYFDDLQRLAEWLGKHEDAARSLALFNGVESAPVALGMEFVRGKGEPVFEVIELRGQRFILHPKGAEIPSPRDIYFDNYEQLRDAGWKRFKDFR